MIGKNVWIGDKITIPGGVSIGDNAIIGAGTVVTHDVPPNTIGGGHHVYSKTVIGTKREVKVTEAVAYMHLIKERRRKVC